MKEFKAKIKYKDKINTMLVSGEDEESVINDITDFYLKLFGDQNNNVEVELDINKKYSSNIKDELADVFIYVLTIADKYNIDLLDALKRKETINLERTWE